jgi:hypothetical protein
MSSQSKGQKAFFAAMDRGLSATQAIRSVERMQGKLEPSAQHPASASSPAQERREARRNAAYNRDDDN